MGVPTVKVVTIVFQCEKVIFVRRELHVTIHSILVSVVIVICNDSVNSVWVIVVFVHLS